MTCTASQLLRDARCYCGMPRSMLAQIRMSLLCEWANAEEKCEHPVVLNWLERIGNDSVALPSQATIRAVCDFCEALDLYGLTDKMLVVNPVIPDSLPSMSYPLIWQPANGSSPFINHNFVPADLDVNGLAGRPCDSTYFDTGFNPFTQWGGDATNLGMSLYESETSPAYADEVELGCYDFPNLDFFIAQMYDAFLGDASYQNESSVINPGLAGDTPAFYSLNQTNATTLRLYQNDAFLDDSATDVSAESPPDQDVYFMALNESTDPLLNSGKRISFMAIHEGLTEPEAEDLFWAVQLLRMDLGGGWL